MNPYFLEKHICILQPSLICLKKNGRCFKFFLSLLSRKISPQYGSGGWWFKKIAENQFISFYLQHTLVKQNMAFYKYFIGIQRRKLNFHFGGKNAKKSIIYMMKPKPKRCIDLLSQHKLFFYPQSMDQHSYPTTNIYPQLMALIAQKLLIMFLYFV